MKSALLACKYFLIKTLSFDAACQMLATVTIMEDLKHCWSHVMLVTGKVPRNSSMFVLPQGLVLNVSVSFTTFMLIE